MQTPRGTRPAKKNVYSSQLEQQIQSMNEQWEADRERIKQLEQTQKDMEESQRAMQELMAKFMSSQQSGGQSGWEGAGGG